MQSLRPTNRFELDMTDVAFPRQFPIDNETAREWVLYRSLSLFYISHFLLFVQ